MEEEIKYIYLDTSAINKIAKFSDEYIEKILNNMKRMNHYFVISEIDLIEIFNNQNVEIREKLVITLQKIIQVELITNPELLLIAALEKDDNLIDKYKYLTNDINNTFIDILENKDKTFVLSKESEELLIEKSKKKKEEFRIN